MVLDIPCQLTWVQTFAWKEELLQHDLQSAKLGIFHNDLLLWTRLLSRFICCLKNICLDLLI